MLFVLSSISLSSAALSGSVYRPVQWRSAIAGATGTSKEALADCLEKLSWSDQKGPPDIALLSVPLKHARELEELTAEAAREMGASLLVGVVGTGVIGDGKELDRQDQPGISLLAGRLPDGTRATPFVVNEDRGFPNWAAVLEPPAGYAAESKSAAPRPGFLIFADPFSAVSAVTSLLNDLSPGACVAGGLSCPLSDTSPSIALYEWGARCRALQPGSLVGICLQGQHFEMHSLTAQGAAPVGPSFLVTEGGGENGNLIAALDGKPAVAVLQELARDQDERVVKLLQRSLLVGTSVSSEAREEGEIGPSGGTAGKLEEDEASDEETDFLIRQVLGANAQGGLYIGERVEVGKTRLQFHVRDDIAAADELSLRLGRYKLERTLSGRFSDGRGPLAAFQFSCNGRGLNMYSGPNRDSDAVRGALGEALPTGGFFCNGEIGPLGVKGIGASAQAPTFVHGFTTCLALLYDTQEGQ